MNLESLYIVDMRSVFIYVKGCVRMWKLYCFGIVCPIAWVLAIVVLIDGFKCIGNYKSMKLSSSKAKAARSFTFSGILFVIAIITTVQLVDVMQSL